MARVSVAGLAYDRIGRRVAEPGRIPIGSAVIVVLRREIPELLSTWNENIGMAAEPTVKARCAAFCGADEYKVWKPLSAHYFYLLTAGHEDT